MTTQTASTGLSGITPHQWLILLMVQLCTLLFGMTITMANVVLPQIKGSMSATQDQIAWVITFNLIATAIGTPCGATGSSTEMPPAPCVTRSKDGT